MKKIIVLVTSIILILSLTVGMTACGKTPVVEPTPTASPSATATATPTVKPTATPSATPTPLPTIDTSLLFPTRKYLTIPEFEALEAGDTGTYYMADINLNDNKTITNNGFAGTIHFQKIAASTKDVAIVAPNSTVVLDERYNLTHFQYQRPYKR